MSVISPVKTPAESLLEINTIRQHNVSEEKQIPPAAASALAVPVELARAEVNQASLLPALRAPTADGIFSVGAVSVKVSSSVSAISKSRGWNSWGF